MASKSSSNSISNGLLVALGVPELGELVLAVGQRLDPVALGELVLDVGPAVGQRLDEGVALQAPRQLLLGSLSQFAVARWRPKVILNLDAMLYDSAPWRPSIFISLELYQISPRIAFLNVGLT